jgi:hypothetical protein
MVSVVQVTLRVQFNVRQKRRVGSMAVEIFGYGVAMDARDATCVDKVQQLLLEETIPLYGSRTAIEGKRRVLLGRGIIWTRLPTAWDLHGRRWPPGLELLCLTARMREPRRCMQDHSQRGESRWDAILNPTLATLGWKRDDN